MHTTLCTPPSPEIELDSLIEYLQARGTRWTTSDQITAALGFNKRKIAALRESAGGRIISNRGGHGRRPGYKLVNHATKEEFDAFINQRTADLAAIKIVVSGAIRCWNTRGTANLKTDPSGQLIFA